MMAVRNGLQEAITCVPHKIASEQTQTYMRVCCIGTISEAAFFQGPRKIQELDQRTTNNKAEQQKKIRQQTKVPSLLLDCDQELRLEQNSKRGHWEECRLR
jgi:hypothetical protein